MTYRMATDKEIPANPADIAEMDDLFRRADFASENPGLGVRLRAKIQARIAAQHQKCEMLTDERALSEDELSQLAAAGSPTMHPGFWNPTGKGPL